MKAEKRLRLTPKQQDIVEKLRVGRSISNCGGRYFLTYETHMQDGDCPTCGHEIPGEVIPKRTFEAMVRKGILVPSVYWIANIYSEDGDHA